MFSKLFLVCLLSLYSLVSNAQQIDTTGNLINNNGWVGATYGVDPNDCCTSVSGAGPLYDTSSNTIKFSYGNSGINNIIGLNQALGGTGVQVHGYNYSLDYILMPNGNNIGNDYLFVDVWIIDSSNLVQEYTSTNYSSSVGIGMNDQWNSVSRSSTFNNPYTDPEYVVMRLRGYDGGFWAGYYGPEVRNVSLSVNYSFDPCASDPLYSSSCPGYWDAFLQAFGSFFGFNSSEPDVDVAVIDYSLPQTTTSIASMPEETTTGEVKVDAGGIEISSTGELTVPDGIPEEAKEKKPVDMNLIMSVVREATDDSKALEVVNKSIQDSTSELSNPDFSGSPVSLTGEILEDPILQTIFLRSSFTERSSGEDLDMSTEETTAVTTQQQTVQESQQQQVVIVETQEQTEEVTVKQNVEPNEAASGVDIASIAISPTGFNDYLTKSLIDARFYEEKEIYVEQTVVDNRRAQRLLSGASDRLHKKMVDQQYRQ